MPIRRHCIRRYSQPSMALAAALLCATAAHAQGGETFKIAFIDPLSGPFVSTGELMRDHVQYAVEDVNAKGGLFNGAKLQLLQFDSKLSAQESQAALQAALDQGARVVVTGDRARRWWQPWCRRPRATTSAIRARRCWCSTTPPSTPS